MEKITVDIGVLRRKLEVVTKIIWSEEIPAGVTIGLKDGRILCGTGENNEN